MENKSITRKYLYFWLILSLVTAIILYSHLFTVFPQVLNSWLTEPIHSQVSHGHSLELFCSLLVLQIFLAGIFIDKYGIRLLVLTAALIVFLGSYFFAKINTNSVIFILFSRILMAAGLALVGVGYMKIIIVSLPPKLFALMGGLFITAALLGYTLTTQDNFSWLPYNWQQVVIFTISLTLILGGLFVINLRDHQSLPSSPKWTDILKAFQNTQNWALAGYSGMVLAPVIILASVFGKPFFVQVYQYNDSQIKQLGLLLLLGIGLGCPIVGYISSRINRHRVFMLGGILIQELTFLPLIYLHQMPFWVNELLLLVFGLASSAFILSFSIAREINQLSVCGSMIALIKTGIILSAAFTEKLLARFFILDWNGISDIDYDVIFIIFPIYLLVGFLLLLIIEEPYS